MMESHNTAKTAVFFVFLFLSVLLYFVLPKVAVFSLIMFSRTRTYTSPFVIEIQ